MWTEKYRPETLSEFKGSRKEVEEVKQWIEGWEKGDQALLLHGPPGCGKTALVHSLANELDRELFETNASEARRKGDVKDKLEQAVKQRSFTGKDKLILVDEVDGMGRSDRGGRKVINRLLKETKFPLILTANDPYASGMKSLRNKAKEVELGNVHTNSVAARLREICEREGIEYDDEAVKSIAQRADGDLRSAINDLESLATDSLKAEDVKDLGYRETERDIFEALKIVFKSTSASTASDATEGVEEDYGKVFGWIRENVPKEYKREGDLSRAYDNLSEADVFRGRMQKRQDWSLLKYVYGLMTVGVSLSKEEKYSGWTSYSYPSTIKKMGRSKAARNKRDAIGKKVGKKLHLSISEASDTIPFLNLLFQKEEWKEELVRKLELDEKEVDYIEDF
ncbi:MAG: replication factor C large subunit [Candidatus Nanohaloarchaeota archaeon QJJ-7]|nr:replication factor C large subunit [Candidatus Nanohaloarchaeota archaeon QJJ-7]